MKKFFEYIGMISLACFSFFFTEKTVNVVKEADNIMIEIKKAVEMNKTESIDAIIKEDTIIPGIYGKVVDEEKSYQKKKRVCSYQENLLVYKQQKPNIQLKNQYDKYIISGNPKKNMVSLIFLVKENDNVNKIEAIIEQKDIKVSFFIDGTWFENNNDKILSWASKNYTIGNLSYNMNYTNTSFVWMDTIIKKIGNQKVSYCYNETPNQKALEMCALNKNYTIRPTLVVDKYPLTEIKENLAPGSIIALPINETVIRELPVIIEFIKGKGYEIENLYNHLEEISEYGF